MAIKTLRVFAEYTSTGFVPMPAAGGIDYGYTLANTFPSTTPSSFQTDDPDIDVTVTAMTDFYVWIRISGTAWNPSYTRNVRVYPDSPDINNVVMNMIIATGPAGTSAYSQIVQTSNRLYFNGATADSTYNSKFAGKTYINELNFGAAPGLATVATTGAYADLTGKPALSTVATSGSYADLSNKPSGTAPISYNSGTNSFQISVASASTNGYLTSTDWSTFNAKYLLPSGGTTAQYLRGDGTLATFPTTLDSTRLIFTGKNSTGSTLTKGTVVYINGVSGNTALLAKALATQDSTSAQTLGVVEFDIANNASGTVVLVGTVGNLDTSSFTEGVQLYLSGTTAGAYTSTKNLAPIHLVYVGIVTRAHPTQGTIEVKVQNGYELDEIHDVQISSPADKDILYRDSASSLWKHASIASVLGYTPYNATNPSNYIALTALSASAPLSYNNTTGAFTISQANTSTNGFLSSTDWNTFNSKQSALTIGNFTEVNSNVFMFPDGTTGKTIGNLSIQMIQAGASTNGYLSSTDWSTFNSKQGAITLTTTGTSGAATFSANTLNIPQYQAGLNGTGFVKASGTTISYDNSTYLTTSSASSTYLPLAGGTLIGALNGTSATFSGTVTAASYSVSSNGTISSNGFWGTLHTKGSGSSSDWAIINSTGNGIMWNPTGTLNMSFGGRIGVGTATPSVSLQVIGNGNFTNSGASDSLFSINSTFADGYRAILRLSNTHTGGKTWDIYSTNNGDGVYGGGKFVIRNNTDNLNALTITSDGNVGIGLVPGSWNSTYKAIQLRDATSMAMWSGGYDSNITTNAIATTLGGAVYGGASAGASKYTQYDGAHYFYSAPSGTAGNAITFTERMRITSTGNVGINTSSPVNPLGYGLTIEGSSYAPLYLTNSGATRGYFVGYSGGLIINASTGILALNNGGGNVLINTTTDNGYRLYVSGTIYATGNITANSDLTLKKNLKLVENPIDKLNQLNGYLYQWKEDDSYQYGVIAQEVEKILPHAVSTGKDGIKGVSYNQIIPLLIEGFKVQQKEINELKSKIG